MTDLDDARRKYADALRVALNLRSEALINALAKVAREHFLGPGPWQILDPAVGGYRITADADPRHLYEDVLVAIDAGRNLNNGQPSYLTFCLDSLDIQAGDRVLHVGCGVGYYMAIIAEVVGADGHVIGVEIDAKLASRAQKNLAYLNQVEVVHADGGEYDAGSCDVIFINAGATHPRPVWLDSLRHGGRLILFLTASFDASGVGKGGALRIKREDRGYAAHFLSSVTVFDCLGCRDERSNQRLREAMTGGGWKTVKSLRREAHERKSTCWLHGDGFCLVKSSRLTKQPNAP